MLGLTAGSVGLNALSPLLLPRPREIDTNDSLWSLALPPVGAALDRSIEADVVIVGGGYTGLSAAWALRRQWPGRRVVLLEAKRCGNGASGRNGAMLLTTTADRYLVAGEDPSMDRRIHDLTVENMALLASLGAELGVDPELERNGALHVLLDSAQAGAARTTVAQLNDRGIPAHYLDAARTADRLGTRVYAGAIENPVAGQVHPGQLLAMWREAAARAGTDIFEETAVDEIVPGDPVVVRTVGGHEVRARHLVLATNAYGPDLGFLTRAIAGVWDYVISTRSLSEHELKATGWTGRVPYDDGHVEVYYLGITRDRRVHIGGGPIDYGFNGAMPDAARRRLRFDGLRQALTRIMPSLAGVEIEREWAGLVDMSLDASPAVGSLGSQRNVHYAVGFSGHGVNLSSVFGRILADLVAGERERWRWFPYLDRLPPYLPNEPFRWLGIRAQLAAIRATGG